MYGDFNLNGGPFDGATTKTRNIYSALKSKYLEVNIFNFEDWKKRPVRKMLELRSKIKKADSVVFVPGAKHGTIFALKMFYRYRKSNKKFFYFIAGSLLPKYISEDPKLVKYLFPLCGIFCETNGLIKELSEYGLKNLYFSPTFDLRGTYEFAEKSKIKKEPSIFVHLVELLKRRVSVLLVML